LDRAFLFLQSGQVVLYRPDVQVHAYNNLIPWLAHGRLLVVAGDVVPLDAVGVEVVQDSKAGLLMGWVLPGSSVVWLRKSSPSGVGPMGAGCEGDGSRVTVGPEYSFLAVVNNSAGPKVSLLVLSNQSVEFILFFRRIERDRFHAHGLTVGQSLRLLECRTSKLPGHNISSPHIISGVGPEVIGRLGPAEGGSTCRPLRLALNSSHGLGHGPYWLRYRSTELLCVLLEGRLGLGLGLKLRLWLEGRLLLRLELLLGLESRRSWLLLLLLLLLELLRRTALRWTTVGGTEQVVECVGEVRKESILWYPNSGADQTNSK